MLHNTRVKPIDQNRTSRRNSRRNSIRPQFERLEERALLAVVSWWTADNTAADAVGGNHGSLVSGASYATGKINQAFKFDGVNDRVGIPDSNSFKLTQSLSIEGWVRVDAYPASNTGSVILFRGDDRGGLDPYSLSVNPNGSLVFQVSSLANGASIAAPIPVGEFIHVAATLDDATGAMKLYENGVLMTQATTTVRPFADLDPASNPAVGIGNHGGYPATPHNFPFNGLIDDLKLYDNPLSASQVLADFNAGKGSLQPTVRINDRVVTEGDLSFSYLNNFANSDTPYHLVYGPDGNLYVTTLIGSSVLRYDGISGAPLPAPGKPGAEFVSPGAGGLNVARNLAFGPDGNLYVVSQNTNAVLRFDAVTGNALGDFIPSGSGGLDQPRGLLFHTDGYLYVTSVGGTVAAPGQDSILRYDAVTGAPAGVSEVPGDAVFINSGIGGLDNPSHIVFRNGEFYVASTSPSTSNSILRYAPDGSFLGAFVPTGSGGLAGPSNFVFQGGYLYVTSWTNNKVLRYDGVTGSFVDEVVSGNGLVTPLGILFEPDGDFLVTSRDTNEIRRYGELAAAVFTVSLNAPFPTSVAVNFNTVNSSAIAGASNDYLATSGTLTFAPGQTSRTIVVSTVDDAAAEPTETFTVNLSSPVGASIADSVGVGTILDNDPFTKFYVVNDATTTTDRTYEYQAGGAAIENYPLGTGNSAPRGAASTALGDKVWVVDANRKVYVYNTNGGLLGSWTAGSLPSNAQVEGIATDGTNIYIVDGKTKTVYRYVGAASLLTGTQNAEGELKLHRDNANPRDIVSDGKLLYVVDDSTTDKVFKYQYDWIPGVRLVLYSTWTITTPLATKPTGITLDPSNPAHLWIVDAGTARVYEYRNALNQPHGSSKSADVSFALAPGNTNPQGIADPPAGATADRAPTASAVGRSSAASHDFALLSLIQDLDSLHPTARRRK